MPLDTDNLKFRYNPLIVIFHDLYVYHNNNSIQSFVSLMATYKVEKHDNFYACTLLIFINQMTYTPVHTHLTVSCPFFF